MTFIPPPDTPIPLPEADWDWLETRGWRGGRDVQRRGRFESTALMWALRCEKSDPHFYPGFGPEHVYGSLAVARRLLEAGVERNAIDCDGQNAFWYAGLTAGGVRFLVEQGVCLPRADPAGRTPLMVMAEAWDSSLAQDFPVFHENTLAFLEAGADPHHESPDGETLLSIAAEEGAEALAFFQKALVAFERQVLEKATRQPEAEQIPGPRPRL
jgi:ankyrin repeat protein